MATSLFANAHLQKIAGLTGFYKRNSDFTPAMFFDILLFCANSSTPCSLENAATRLREEFGVKITKQSVDGRFNKESVRFVQEILSRTLEQQLNSIFNPDFLPEFNRVCIKDGTRFNLPARLAEHYHGYGGTIGTSKAGLCIQYEYDARSGKVLDLNITHGTRTDSRDASETVNKVQAGDFNLRDLGYYKMSVFRKIEKQDAFYLSRLGSNTNVYQQSDMKEVLFNKIYSDMRKNKINSCELDVCIGKTERLNTRLVMAIVPEPIYQKRIKELTARNKSKGYEISKETRARLRFNIFVTNIKKETLELEKLLVVYKLRWQVELMFKNWKSICCIDKIQPMKYERFICILMAKLILIVLNLQIIWKLKSHLYSQRDKLLSLYKCFKTLRERFENFMGILKKKKKDSKVLLAQYIDLLFEHHWRDSKKHEDEYCQSYEDILDVLICKSDK